MSKHLSKCRTIIESIYGVKAREQFLFDFIDVWSFLHSDRYPVDGKDIEQEFMSKAAKLSDELSLILQHGLEHDALGMLLSEYSQLSDSKLAFYPTPVDVSKLCSSLIGSSSGVNEIKVYEPCCGTGGLTFSALINIAMENSTNENPLGHITLSVEDINPTVVKAFFLQVNFLLSYLSNLLQKGVIPKNISIRCVDVFTRESKGIEYYMEGSDQKVESDKFSNKTKH